MNEAMPAMAGNIYCPRDANSIPGKEDGKPLWSVMALPFHLIGKICKICGEPVADHIIIIKDLKP